MTAAPRSTDFVALGRPGSEAYAGLETFANPGVADVELTSDELTAVCPITGQPDMYRLTIGYRPDGLCVESKSLKLYLNRFRNEGAFCEALAVQDPRRDRRASGSRPTGCGSSSSRKPAAGSRSR